MKRSLKHHTEKGTARRDFFFARKRKPLLTIIPVVLLLSGAYLLFLLWSPAVQSPGAAKKWNAPVPHVKAELTENRIYIPKLKLNLAFKTGDATVLRDNLWHRYPERGDPEKGGNFILAGHRFEIGLTPGETKRKSPLYHIDALQQGDKIYADFNGKRYMYEVADRIKVKPDQVSIEAPSAEPKMTLYSCTFQGSADGREVVVAHLAQKDIDPMTSLASE